MWCPNTALKHYFSFETLIWNPNSSLKYLLETLLWFFFFLSLSTWLNAAAGLTCTCVSCYRRATTWLSWSVLCVPACLSRLRAPRRRSSNRLRAHKRRCAPPVPPAHPTSASRSHTSTRTPRTRTIESPERVGTLLDYQRGRLHFYNALTGQLLGSFKHNFTGACHPVLALEMPGRLEVGMVAQVPEFAQG